jgi:ribosomal protein S8
LVGTVKEVIPQISHSKKWWKGKDKNGVYVNTYSRLQDNFCEHMKAAGFIGFERGEKGSTAEHLDVLDYKIQQDNKRLENVTAKVDKKQKEVEHLNEATRVRVGVLATQTEIDEMAKPGKSGKNMVVPNDDWARVSEMAKRCAILDEKVREMKSLTDKLRRERDAWKKNYERLWGEVKDFIKAIKIMPNKLLTFIAENLSKSKNREETL